MSIPLFINCFISFYPTNNQLECPVLKENKISDIVPK
jgi:hypothetical protein